MIGTIKPVPIHYNSIVFRPQLLEMSVNLVCCLLSAFLCVIQSSNSLASAVYNHESVDSVEKNMNIHNSKVIDHIELPQIPQSAHVHKRSVNCERNAKSIANQISLLFILDVKTLKPNDWAILRRENIRKIVNSFAQRPDDPIFDYIFFQVQFDGEFLKMFDPKMFGNHLKLCHFQK